MCDLFYIFIIVILYHITLLTIHNIQDSRGSLYWINWPTDPFASHGNEEDNTGYRGEKAKALPILDHTPAIKSLMASECNTTGSLFSIQSAPMPVTENEKSIIERKNDLLQGNNCTSGDTFSGTTATAADTCTTTSTAATDTPRSRPVSLALDTQIYNNKLQTSIYLFFLFNSKILIRYFYQYEHFL